MSHVLLPRIAAVVATVAALLLIAAPASAHNGHAALPDGFRAEITAITDAGGKPVALNGVTFEVEPGGIGLTVTNTTSKELVLTGEQAGEPLVRLTADRAEVNQASPQAVDVEGATVDPSAAAELIDLVWQRAETDWVALPAGGTVVLVDHRGAPGHAPVRSEHETGHVAGTFPIRFTYDGESYEASGEITAVEPSDAGISWPLWMAAAALLFVAGAGVIALLRRAARKERTTRPQPA